MVDNFFFFFSLITYSKKERERKEKERKKTKTKTKKKRRQLLIKVIFFSLIEKRKCLCVCVCVCVCGPLETPIILLYLIPLQSAHNISHLNPIWMVSCKIFFLWFHTRFYFLWILRYIIID
jgi:hypothetical protein